MASSRYCSRAGSSSGAPSLVETILGDTPTRMIEQSNRPVVVVRDLD
jgi:nucleotide-binding universal stress UspA family protein